MRSTVHGETPPLVVEKRPFIKKNASYGRFFHWGYAFMSGPVALAALSLGGQDRISDV